MEKALLKIFVVDSLRKGLRTRTLVFTHRYSFTSEGIYHRHVRFLNVPQIHDVLVSCGAVIYKNKIGEIDLCCANV